MAYDRVRLRDEIKHEEGWRPYGYDDKDGSPVDAPRGLLTIGFGFLIDARKGGALPLEVAEFWLDHILDSLERELDRALPWWTLLGEGRGRALMQMAYQLGVPSLLDFTDMLGALKAGEYQQAAEAALDSKWAREDTPERARRVARLIEIG